MEKPIIGIITDVILRDSSALSNFRSDYVTSAVIDSIQEAEGLPMVLPINTKKQIEENIDQYMEICDGFYFVGGADIDPQFYGEDPHWKSGPFDTEKDYFEIQIARRAYKEGKAILGNCRGIQLINVALGGTIYQDLESSSTEFFVKHENLDEENPARKPTHYVTIDKKSYLYPIIGERVFVNSRHHQAIKEVSPHLEIVGRSNDGVIEVVQTRKNDQIVAVQWHPENLWKDNENMLGIYKNFIERVKKYCKK